jgi:hypothetical protein
MRANLPVRFLAISAVVVCASQSWTQAADTQKLLQLYAAIEAADRDLPRETFEPEAVIEQVGRDPEKLFEWVRDHTEWVAYQGALRGPSGVLMDRVGDSLDRSLLLAELLRLSGYKVRLAHADLKPEQVQELLPKLEKSQRDAMTSPTASEELTTRYATLAGVSAAEFQAIAQKSAATSAAARKQINEVVSRQVPMILAALGQGEKKSEAAVQDRRLKALADHWWVQRQKGTAWVDYDPLLPNAASGQALAAATQTIPITKADATIPLDKRLCHEIGVKVIVEQWNAGRVTEQPVLNATLRPAEVLGERIALSHSPLPPSTRPASKTTDAAALTKEMLARKHWLAVLTVGTKPIFESSFSDTGQVERNPQEDPTARVAGGINRGFGMALGGGDDQPSAAGLTGALLTAEWVEFEIRSPGETPKTVRREVFDLLGPAARAARPAPAPKIDDAQRLRRACVLAGEVEILPTVCRLSDGFVADVAIKRFLAARYDLLALGDPATAGDQVRAAALQKLVALPDVLYNLALLRLTTGSDRASIYQDRPNIFCLRESLAIEPDGKLSLDEGLDVAFNDVAVRSGASADALRIRLAQGVIDTAAEAALAPATSVPQNTTQVFAQVVKGADDMVVLRSARDPNLQSLSAPPDVRARLQMQLAQGYTIIAPKQGAGAGDAMRTGWWRVDPLTGTSVGVMDNGFNSAAADRQVLMLINGLRPQGQLIEIWSLHMFRGMTYGQFVAYMGIPAQPAMVALWNVFLNFL